MVLLLSTTNVNMRIGASTFTFQYGSTFITFTTYAACLFNQFTFQYGSTFIYKISIRLFKYYLFTFQYGSTFM